MLSTVWPKSYAKYPKVPLADGVYCQVARNLSHVARNFSYEKKVKSPKEINTKKI